MNGTLTGTHALVNNALATKQPFGQAALGTWHFRKDNPTGFEARTNEHRPVCRTGRASGRDQRVLLRDLSARVCRLSARRRRQHGTSAAAAFPDDYPNKTIPLPATVHIPNIYLALDAAGGKLAEPDRS